LKPKDLSRAALRGEPSYVWRAGQERRWEMILRAADDREHGFVLDNGCGVGQYLKRMHESASLAIGLEYEREYALSARAMNLNVVQAAAEELPYPPDTFNLILSHEVLEHVADDRRALEEMARILRRPDSTQDITPGRLILFAPNRGYPFETHGIYWRGRYHFGNIPLVNYLPRPIRNRLAPHVRVYTRRDLQRLLTGLPLHVVSRTIIFGAYDNIIARWPLIGKPLRFFLQALEKSPFRMFGLSHFWVIERETGAG
jgi:SAM-dependent methyltransferase